MQARNAAKGAVAKGGSCRGVFQALGWGQEWKLQVGFSSPWFIFGKRPGANQRNWHRNTSSQQRPRVEAAGVFFKPWVEAKSGSCRGVFQALGWFLESGQMLTKGAGIETPFGNRRRWKREWLGRPGTWQKQVRQRVEAAGGFFKPWVLQLVVRPQTALSNVTFWTVEK